MPLRPSQADNPVARQQWLRFRRLGPRWWILLALVWLPATWFLRFRLSDFLMTNATGGTWPISATLGVLFANFVLRADVPLILLTCSLMMPAAEWKAVRSALVLTFLRPRELLEGVLFVPFGLLILFNAIGAPFFYADLFASVDPDCPSRGCAWAFMLTLGAMAFLEDLFFGAICLLALIQERLRGSGHTPQGLAAAAALILRAGLMVGLLALSQMVLEALMGSATTAAADSLAGSEPLASLVAVLDNGFVRQFATNLVSMAMVLAYEVRVARGLWGQSLRQLESWVDGPGDRE